MAFFLDSNKHEVVLVAGLRRELQQLYDDLQDEIQQLGPVCELSGRCCRFAEHGHTLFVSAPEFEILLADAPPPIRPIDAGETCPWQDFQGRCTAHASRPLGCQVYYCDNSYLQPGQELCERFIRRLKVLFDQYSLPWDYAPLHMHLRRALESGRWPDDQAARVD